MFSNPENDIMGFFNSLIFIIFNLIISFLVAFFIARKRRIGFFGSFLFSVSLGSLFGFIITLFSGRIGSPIPKPNLFKRTLGVIICALGLIWLVYWGNDGLNEDVLNRVHPIQVVGWTVFGFYLYRIGNGVDVTSRGVFRIDP
jgi:hypothetical protein